MPVDRLLAAYEKGDTKALITILEKQALQNNDASDSPAFQKTFTQLKPLYNLSSPVPNTTKSTSTVIGLHLLTLLADSEAGSFHATLEALPDDLLTSAEVSWVRNLERGLTEGSYTDLRSALLSPPNKSFTRWSDLMVPSIRAEIADCAESSYTSIPITNLTTLLLLPNVHECEVFARERGWKMKNGKVEFSKEDMEVDPVNSTELRIQQTLGYARELESIV